MTRYNNGPAALRSQRNRAVPEDGTTTPTHSDALLPNDGAGSGMAPAMLMAPEQKDTNTDKLAEVVRWAR